ncbi:hypothetical protein [uncultured Sphingomonas sp.]|uniref:hypothetical protein n=1 Tax=uncultured Sphingomonas sp. TaxID=158754 RepID=UPI0025FC715A|nr:hypothetical protein [uncultured Sphingomonas sp.]
MFSRAKIGAAAQEIANHLQLVEHVKALQDGQKAIADSIAVLNDRIRAIELEMSTLKAEVKLEALKEAQGVIFAVQGGLNQRIEDVAVQVAVLRATGGVSHAVEGARRAAPPSLQVVQPGHDPIEPVA